MVTICSFPFFVPFYTAFFTSTMLTFQEKVPKFTALFDKCEFHSDFNLDDLFVRTSKIVLKDRETDRQTQTTKSSENLLVPISHQTICPSETICPSSIV